MKGGRGGCNVQCAYCATRPRPASRGSSRWNIPAVTPVHAKRDTPPRGDDDFNPIELKHDTATKRFAKQEAEAYPRDPGVQEPAAVQLDPELVQDYTVVALIGEGSQGRVLKLQHKTTGKVVAAKHLWSGAAKSLSRFEREIAASNASAALRSSAGSMSGTSHSSTLLLMEFVEGLNLATGSSSASARSSPSEAFILAARLAEGLAYTASQKIVHRDVKPGNVSLTPTTWRKLLDFGLAKLEDDRRA